MDGEGPYRPLKRLCLNSVRNGEPLRSITEGVLSPSAQRDDSAEGRLRATSLEATVIGQARADESLSWALQYKGGGGGEGRLCGTGLGTAGDSTVDHTVPPFGLWGGA